MTVVLLKSHIVKYQLDFRRLSLSKDPNPMLFCGEPLSHIGAQESQKLVDSFRCLVCRSLILL